MGDDKLEFVFGIVNPADWQDTNTDEPLPLQQHPTYGRALTAFGAGTEQVTILHNGTPVARALLISRRFMGLVHVTTMFRGPVWCSENITNHLKSDVYQKLKHHFSPWRWNFFIALPELSDTPDNQLVLKHAKYRRIMTGFSTSWVDLRTTEDELRASLKGKWRNQLVGAEKANLTISIGGKKEHQYSWLLEKEEAQRSNRRYQATPLGLVPAFVSASTSKSESAVISVTALSGRRKVAGALFLRHGNSATYHIGWAGEDGRKHNAQNRVLWEGMLELKRNGVRFLDLGGLNTADLAGIARFKLGLGANPTTLVGAYI